MNSASRGPRSKDADCASGDCHKGAGDYQNKCKAPSRPAAFYAAPANFAARTSDKLQFKLDGSEGKNGKCLSGAWRKFRTGHTQFLHQATLRSRPMSACLRSASGGTATGSRSCWLD